VVIQHESYIGIKVIDIFITKHMIDGIVNSTNVTSAVVCVTGMQRPPHIYHNINILDGVMWSEWSLG